MKFLKFKLSRKWNERIARWKEGWLWWLGYPWFVLTSTLRWIGSWFSRAWGTRNLRYMLQGVPAVLGAVGVIVATSFVVFGYDRVSLGKDYLIEWNKAVKNEDYKYAKVCIEKALLLEGENRKDYKFYLANTLERLGQSEQCFAIMSKLAPEDANGYSWAHIWMGDLYARALTISEASIRRVENQYRRGFNQAMTEKENKAMQYSALKLGTLYMNLKRFEDAEPFVKKSTEIDPGQQIALASLYAAMNREEEAMREFAGVEAFFRKQVNDHPDNKVLRYKLADTLIGQKRFGDAVAELQAAITAFPNDNQLKEAISQVYSLWDIHLGKDPKAKVTDRLALVQMGLRYFPTHPRHLFRLIEISNLTGEEGDKARQQVDDLIAKGSDAPVVLHLLANKLYAEGKIDAAREHWEKAIAIDPNAAVVLNNLAYIFSHQEKPDLPRSLDMVNKAIEKIPQIHEFHGTKGVILVKMEKFKEAREELKIGIQKSPNNIELQECMAVCYEKDGLQSIADIHRRKAEELRAKAKTNPANLPGLNTLSPPQDSKISPAPDISDTNKKPSDPPADKAKEKGGQ